jgi:ribosomal protein L37AE/L43A
MHDFLDGAFYKAFGIKKARYPRGLVEHCEVITASTPGIFARLRLSVTATQLREGVFRHWFECPGCKRRCFKLYRPPGGKIFACRKCNHLVHTSALKRNPDGSPKKRINSKPHVPFQEERPINDSGHLATPAPTKWLPKPNRGGYIGPP